MRFWGNRKAGGSVQSGVDDEEREALRAEGLDPDDPAVAGAIDRVRWELSLLSPNRHRKGPTGVTLRAEDQPVVVSKSRAQTSRNGSPNISSDLAG